MTINHHWGRAQPPDEIPAEHANHGDPRNGLEAALESAMYSPLQNLQWLERVERGGSTALSNVAMSGFMVMKQHEITWLCSVGDLACFPNGKIHHYWGID